MSVSDTDVRQRYQGNGSTTTFAIPFAVVSGELQARTKVYLLSGTDYTTETLKTYTTDYTIVATNVVMGVAPTSVQRVLIIRESVLTQGTDLDNSNPAFLETLETSLDRLTFMVQELAEKAARALKFRKGSNSTNANVPEANDGYALVWNSAGDLANSEMTFQQYVDAAQAAQEAAEDAASAADNSETAAANSATAANASAGAASVSAASAQASANQASASATAAANSAADSLTSANNSAASATSAAASAVTASGAQALLPSGPYNVTDGQAATDLSGETLDGAQYSTGFYFVEIIRGTTVVVIGKFSLHYVNSVWALVLDAFNGIHGVTFTITQAGSVAQLKASLDAGAGNGTIKLKRMVFVA
jgi:hypothetical protein